MDISIIGLDLAKSVFQIHAVDATGQVVVRKALRRSQMLRRSLRSFRLASSAWKRAGRRITGRASLPALATRCG